MSATENGLNLQWTPEDATAARLLNPDPVVVLLELGLSLNVWIQA